MKNDQKLLNEIKKVSNIFDNGKYLEAVSKAKKLLNKLPGNEFLVNIIGLSYLKLGHLEEAKNLYIKAIKTNPVAVSFRNNYANVLKSLQKYEDAEKILKGIIGKYPNYINAINNLANLKKDMKKYEEAIELFKSALKLQPENTIILYNIALCYRSIRDFSQVLKYAKKINETNPQFTLADRIISEIQDYRNDNKGHLEIMKNKILNNQLSETDQIPLFFAMGKAYEDLENFKLSFENYKKANQLKRRTIDYSLSEELNEFELIKKKFLSFKELDSSKNSSKKKIIFICGMPRSGTSLVEQIISAHPKVASLGETDLVYKLLSKNTDFKPEKNNIYQEYSNFVDKFNFSEKVFTDKSLLNFKFVGFIKAFFPDSKIIYLNRDFNNNFLSIFKNDLQGPQLKWSYDAKEIKKFYQIFGDYIKFWNTIFPNYLHEVNYDELVKSPEKISQKIIKYCELEWSENCLNYYDKNKSSIDTASANQANKPVYQSSLNKFENFKEFFNFE